MLQKVKKYGVLCNLCSCHVSVTSKNVAHKKRQHGTLEVECGTFV